MEVILHGLEVSTILLVNVLLSEEIDVWKIANPKHGFQHGPH